MSASLEVGCRMPVELPRTSRWRWLEMRRGCEWLTASALSLVLGGCGYWINPNAAPPTGPGTPSQSGSVTITPTYVALQPGQKFQFTATAPNEEKIEWLVNGTVGGKPQSGQIDSA